MSQTLEDFATELLEECMSGTSISNVIDRLQKFNSELQHHKDTTVGLWCIDRNPKEVTKEWIEENAFQLT